MRRERTKTAEGRISETEAAGFSHRLRTRAILVTILSGILLSVGGAIGLHYVDAIGETLKRSTDLTAPLLSDVLEITQAGRRSRASVRAAAEQCTGIEAAREELDQFDATSSQIGRDLSGRAAAVGATQDLVRIVAIESRFAGVGRSILDACVRETMITGRIAAAGDAARADLGDFLAIFARLEARIGEAADETERSGTLATSGLPDQRTLARLRSDLDGFTTVTDVVGALGSPAAITAYAADAASSCGTFARTSNDCASRWRASAWPRIRSGSSTFSTISETVSSANAACSPRSARCSTRARRSPTGASSSAPSTTTISAPCGCSRRRRVVSTAPPGGRW